MIASTVPTTPTQAPATATAPTQRIINLCALMFSKKYIILFGDTNVGKSSAATALFCDRGLYFDRPSALTGLATEYGLVPPVENIVWAEHMRDTMGVAKRWAKEHPDAAGRAVGIILGDYSLTAQRSYNMDEMVAEREAAKRTAAGEQARGGGPVKADEFFAWREFMHNNQEVRDGARALGLHAIAIHHDMEAAPAKGIEKKSPALPAYRQMKQQPYEADFIIHVRRDESLITDFKGAMYCNESDPLVLCKDRCKVFPREAVPLNLRVLFHVIVDEVGVAALAEDMVMLNSHVNRNYVVERAALFIPPRPADCLLGHGDRVMCYVRDEMLKRCRNEKDDGWRKPKVEDLVAVAQWAIERAKKNGVTLDDTQEKYMRWCIQDGYHYALWRIIKSRNKRLF